MVQKQFQKRVHVRNLARKASDDTGRQGRTVTVFRRSVPNNSFLYSVHLIATCAVRDVIIRGPFEAFRPLNAGSDTSRLRDPARTFPSGPRPSPCIPFHPDPRRFFSPSSLSLPFGRFFLCFSSVEGKEEEARKAGKADDGEREANRVSSLPPAGTAAVSYPFSLLASRSDRRCLDGIYTSKAAKGDIMARPDFTRCRPVRRPRG